METIIGRFAKAGANEAEFTVQSNSPKRLCLDSLVGYK